MEIPGIRQIQNELRPLSHSVSKKGKGWREGVGVEPTRDF